MTYKQKVIGLDIDDVILDFVPAWLDIYNRDYNDNVQSSNIKSWAVDKYVKCGIGIYEYLKRRDLYDNVQLIPNALYGIFLLRSMGFRVIFVTSSTPEQGGVKYFTLNRLGISVDKRDYFEAKDKSLILCDWLIDDNPENVINAHGLGIVYTQAWNTHLKNYPRVNDWNDIARYFTLLKETGI